MLIVIMLIVVMLNIVILSVVALIADCQYLLQKVLIKLCSTFDHFQTSPDLPWPCRAYRTAC
jgi:hypothetical protein